MKFNEYTFKAAARITAAAAEEAEPPLTAEGANQVADFFDALYRRLNAAACGENEEPVRPGSFEVYTDNAGAFRFRLKAANGEVIAVSQSYQRKESCLKGVESVMHSAPGAAVRET